MEQVLVAILQSGGRGELMNPHSLSLEAATPYSLESVPLLIQFQLTRTWRI